LPQRLDELDRCSVSSNPCNFSRALLKIGLASLVAFKNASIFGTSALRSTRPAATCLPGAAMSSRFRVLDARLGFRDGAAQRLDGLLLPWR